MSGTEVRHLNGEDLPSYYQARAGMELRDWAGDSVRFSDGGDGSMFLELGPYDVSVHPEAVEALRDYLTEVLNVGKERQAEEA